MGLELTRWEEKTLKRLERIEKRKRRISIASRLVWLSAICFLVLIFFDASQILVVGSAHGLSVSELVWDHVDSLQQIYYASPGDGMKASIRTGQLLLHTAMFFISVGFAVLLPGYVKGVLLMLKLHRRLQELGDLPGIEIAARGDSQTTDDPDASAH
ncbi:MAG: hypothetical protein QGH74_00645 [Candidatus Brocadiia bacterium]|jgi:hypothetical protein|nr:hypothetical protein [Candidatus Brocadiia bacterium]